MTEGMERALGQGHRAIGDSEDDTGCPEREESVAGARSTDADGGGSVISAAARDGNLAVRKSPFGRNLRREEGRDLRAFDEQRHLRFLQAAGGEQGGVPSTLGDVEPQGAGAVGHLRHIFAGHAEAHVILRQENHCRFREHLRFVFRDPQQLRRGEARHRGIAGARREVRQPFQQFPTFGA